MIRLSLILVALTVASVAEARMYQWVDPATGSTQMSGNPPAWYRSEWGGPRTWVYDNGRVVDDTAIQVSDEQGEALRMEAFRQLDEQMELQALKRLEKDALKEAARDDRPFEPDVIEEEPEELDFEVPDSITDQTIEDLKDLIEQWDQLNLPFGGSE